MPVLTWKHGITRDEARHLIKQRLRLAGLEEKVTWRGDEFSASIGWGVVLDVAGHIEDETVVLEKAKGALGGVVLAKSEDAFREIFPLGKQNSSVN